MTNFGFGISDFGFVVAWRSTQVESLVTQNSKSEIPNPKFVRLHPSSFRLPYFQHFLRVTE
jgi:hypothetical protein